MVIFQHSESRFSVMSSWLGTALGTASPGRECHPDPQLNAAALNPASPNRFPAASSASSNHPSPARTSRPRRACHKQMHKLPRERVRRSGCFPRGGDLRARDQKRLNMPAVHILESSIGKKSHHHHGCVFAHVAHAKESIDHGAICGRLCPPCNWA